MMHALRGAKSVFSWYWRTMHRSPMVLIALSFFGACCIYSLRNTKSSEEILQQPLVLLPLVLIPYAFGAGVISYPVLKGRVILWHGSGLSKAGFVLGASLLLQSQLMIVLILPLVISLCLHASQPSIPGLLLVAMEATLAALQSVAVLTLLSTLLPAFWNSLLHAATVLVCAVLLSQSHIHHPHSGSLHDHLLSVALLPWSMLSDATGARRYTLPDAAFSSVISGLMLGLAIFAYSRNASLVPTRD